MKNKVLGILVLFIFCFIGIGNVKANIAYCSSDDKFTSAGSCRYSNPGGIGSTELNVDLYFGKTEGGKYCAEIKSVNLNTWVDFDNSDIAASRDKVAFDLKNETMSGILNNKSCPKLKFVNDYDLKSSKTVKFTASDKDLNDIACKASQVASLGSECWVLDGSDYKKITDKEMEETVEESENYRDDEANQKQVEKIKKRANKDVEEQSNMENQFENLKQGNSCSALLGTGEDSIAPIIKNVFFVTCVIGIIILIFTVSGDFIKAITSNENEAVATAFKSAKNRIIATLILLLLPVLVNFIVDIINNHVIVVTDSNGVTTKVKIGNVSDCNIN